MTIAGIPALLDGSLSGVRAGIDQVNAGTALLNESIDILGPNAPALLVDGINIVNQGAALVNQTLYQVDAGVTQVKRGLALVKQAQGFLGTAAPVELGAGVTTTDAGVKQLEASAATDSNVTLTGDGPNVSNRPAPKWGLYDSSGAAVITPDSTVDFDYAAKERISDFPIENGSFGSYNKVTLPYDIRLTFVKGGTDGERAMFMLALEAARASIDLYTVITPEFIYQNANVTGVSYRRTSDRGVTLLAAEVQVEEVRRATTAIFTSTKTPSGAKRVSGGPVQAVPPRPEQVPAGGPH